DIINDLNNTNFNNIKLDSILQTLLPARRSDKYQTFMPFTFNLTLTKPFLKEKLLVNAGVQYRPLYRYLLYGFIKTNYFISNQWVTSLTLGYGAYSNFNFGLEAARHWKRAELAFGSNNLIGTIAPFAYTGASAYFRLGINF
ncbi:MAG: hypothetical protein NZ522_08000, partial [Chitinophagales bacterium]|nr:hypothetical protein [Chitinophagales bacterium]